MTNAATTDFIATVLIPRQDGSGIYNILSERKAGSEFFISSRYYIKTVIGTDANSDGNYIITKAFFNAPSSKQTLTEIVLAFEYDSGATVSLDVYYSTADQGTSFTSLYSSAITATGSMQTVSIPLIGSEIANATTYRLKIKASSGMVLYAIERHIRIIGRSR